jgi:anti-anti-sigma factor
LAVSVARQWILAYDTSLTVVSGRPSRHEGAAMELRLDVARPADVAVVHCRGRIVFGQEVDELRLTVLPLFKETNRLVLHLAGIEQIDSEGLAALVGLFISARNRGGELKLADPSSKTRELLRVTRLDEVFDIYQSESAAVESFLHPKAVAAGNKKPA